MTEYLSNSIPSFLCQQMLKTEKDISYSVSTRFRQVCNLLKLFGIYYLFLCMTLLFSFYKYRILDLEFTYF